ncbi:MAG TPA: histidine kinase [Xanthomonadaceae bacterium]|nr:histidine kinase [Xanthomonadaceae bacterium]
MPAEVALGGGRWLTYRRFPAFSRPWLLRRMVPFALAIGTIGGLSSLGTGSTTGDWSLAARVGAYMFLAFMVISQAGPLLATLARHAGWPLKFERIAVVTAVLAGIAMGFAADYAASSYVEREVRPRLAQSGVSTMPAKPGESGGGMKPTKAVNLTLLFLIYASAGGGLALRSYFTEPRRLAALKKEHELEALRRNVQESDLRLSVLQAQVEPHFLFNTLASLRLLIREDPARAESVLDALVQHLRATIPQLRNGEAGVRSTLGQQVDICTGYLELMRVRMGERLHVTVDVAPELRTLAFPPYLLITLVENAIKHGIEPKRGHGAIRIGARRSDDTLVVTVADDGVGLAPGPSSGMGLANVREQLRTRFGDRARLHVGARDGGGTLVEIHVPDEALA